jgi:eukaryotic-like serine/threonine-protein kinase
MKAEQRIGHYQILAPLGAGGMGEVYRARDTRLDREVAIKMLPASLANDAERLRRFEQEARATSALNHPNILTVYDIGTTSEDSGRAPFIVMELLEGEELRAQLKHGAVAPRKAVDYARQIADGLAAAHAKGVVHRDLKPENLFLTADGRVKILDFGLAKLRPPQPGGVDGDAPTQKQITDPGRVMGTVGYMSPEQVRGREADHRSDIFSFGVVLYEMLGGRRPFGGDSAVEVMNAILKEEPPELSETNAKINPALEKIVRRCLEKRPERRFQTASDLGFALEALSFPSSSGAHRLEAVQASDASAATKRGGWTDRIAWIVAGVAVLTALALGVVYVRRPALEAEPVRLYLNPPEKAKLFDFPTISPDGRTLAFIAEVDGKTQLWVRPLGATTARPLVEVRESLPYPFWSPDSQFIAYFEQRKLKKIALAGGAPETLCDAPIQSSGTWGRNGDILFSGGPGGILRVSANGEAVTTVATIDAAQGDSGHFAPTFLPDGRHFLYYVNNPDPLKNGIYLASVEGSETRRRLLSADAWNVGVAVSLAAQSEGYLTFVRQGALLAQPFDFSQNQLVGNPVRIAEQVSGGSAARYSLAINGVLVLLERAADRQLTWFDRTGKKLETVGPTGLYFDPELSPDERRLAVALRDPQSQQSDIHLFDLAGGAVTRFTFDPKEDATPVWSPDGSRLIWASWRDAEVNLFQKAASGAGQDEVLWRSAYRKVADDWSTDGRFILYEERNPQTTDDLWVLPLEGERKRWPWLNTPASEVLAKFSPDGKWIAYQSNESGRDEIYVQAFVPGTPAAGGKRQLSTSGGTNPRWRRDGRELYYLAPGNRLMAVEVTPGAELKAGAPRELFAPRASRVSRYYTMTGDGQRFLFVTSADEASVPPFTVVLNWMAEVKK